MVKAYDSQGLSGVGAYKGTYLDMGWMRSDGVLSSPDNLTIYVVALAVDFAPFSNVATRHPGLDSTRERFVVPVLCTVHCAHPVPYLPVCD